MFWRPAPLAPPRGRWGCSGDASSDGSRLLTYAICRNPWFSKHSFHKYCNLQVFVVHCIALHCKLQYLWKLCFVDP